MCALHIIIRLPGYNSTTTPVYSTCVYYCTHELDALQEIVFKSLAPTLQFPAKPAVPRLRYCLQVKTNARFQFPPFRSRTTFHKIRQQLSTQELPQVSGHPRTVVRFADSPEDRFRLDWIRPIATGAESHGRRGQRNNGRRRHIVHDCFNAGCFL